MMLCYLIQLISVETINKVTVELWIYFVECKQPYAMIVVKKRLSLIFYK